MKRILLFTLLFALIGCNEAIAQDWNVRNITRNPDIGNLDMTDTIKWYAQESIRYTVCPRRSGKPITIPEATTASWIVTDDTDTIWISTYGSVSSNSVVFVLPAGGAALPEDGDYTSYVALLNGDEVIGVIDRAFVQVMYQPGLPVEPIVPPTNAWPALVDLVHQTTADALDQLNADLQTHIADPDAHGLPEIRSDIDTLNQDVAALAASTASEFEDLRDDMVASDDMLQSQISSTATALVELAEMLRYTGTPGIEYTEDNGNELWVTAFGEAGVADGSVVVPEFYDGKKVRGIRATSTNGVRDIDFLFCYAPEIELKENRNGWHVSAFTGSNIELIYIPNVVSIGTYSKGSRQSKPNGAFSYCKNLTTVIAPSLQTLGDHTFLGCTNLTTVVSGNLEYIGAQALKDTRLAYTGIVKDAGYAIFPNLREIGQRAFANNPAIRVAPGSKQLEHIGSGAFRGCTNFLGISSLQAVTHIGSHAFMDTKVGEIRAPQARYVGRYPGDSIRYIHAPLASVFKGHLGSKYVADWQIANNSMLTDMTVGVDVIPTHFNRFRRLTRASFPSAISAKPRALRKLPALQKVVAPNLVAVDSGFLRDATNFHRGQFDRLKFVGGQAFRNTKIRHIKSVYGNTGNDDWMYAPVIEDIGQGAFRTPILVSADFPKTKYIRRNAFGASGHTRSNAQPHVARNLSRISLPKVTVIEGGAFASLTNLAMAYTPNLQILGGSAFRDTALQWSGYQTTPDGRLPVPYSARNLQYAGDYAFWGSKLSSIYLPSLHRIGQRGTFGNNSNLSFVYAPALFETYETTFFECPSLASSNIITHATEGLSDDDVLRIINDVGVEASLDGGVSAIRGHGKIIEFDSGDIAGDFNFFDYINFERSPMINGNDIATVDDVNDRLFVRGNANSTNISWEKFGYVGSEGYYFAGTFGHLAITNNPEWPPYGAMYDDPAPALMLRDYSVVAGIQASSPDGEARLFAGTLNDSGAVEISEVLPFGAIRNSLLHTSNTNNPHKVTAAQVGAMQGGAAGDKYIIESLLPRYGYRANYDYPGEGVERLTGFGHYFSFEEGLWGGPRMDIQFTPTIHGTNIATVADVAAVDGKLNVLQDNLDTVAGDLDHWASETQGKQDQLTAGENITISNNVIAADLSDYLAITNFRPTLGNYGFFGRQNIGDGEPSGAFEIWGYSQQAGYHNLSPTWGSAEGNWDFYDGLNIDGDPVATESWVSNYHAAHLPDISGYATTQQLAAVSNAIPSTNGLASTNWVANYHNSNTPDMTGYATTQQLFSVSNAIPSTNSLASTNWVAANYTPISTFAASTSSIWTAIGAITGDIPSLDGLATTNWVAAYHAQHAPDLSAYALSMDLLNYVPTMTFSGATQQLWSAIGDVRASIPTMDGYATEAYVQAWHNSHMPDLSIYATTSSLSNYTTLAQFNIVTSSLWSAIGNVSNAIPSLTGYATLPQLLAVSNAIPSTNGLASTNWVANYHNSNTPDMSGYVTSNELITAVDIMQLYVRDYHNSNQQDLSGLYNSIADLSDRISVLEQAATNAPNPTNEPPPVVTDTWASVADLGSTIWQSLAVSRNGQSVIAAPTNGYIYYTRDFGSSWTNADNAGYRKWRKVAVNVEGDRPAAIVNGTYHCVLSDTNYFDSFGDVGNYDDIVVSPSHNSSTAFRNIENKSFVSRNGRVIQSVDLYRFRFKDLNNICNFRTAENDDVVCMDYGSSSFKMAFAIDRYKAAPFYYYAARNVTIPMCYPFPPNSEQLGGLPLLFETCYAWGTLTNAPVNHIAINNPGTYVLMSVSNRPGATAYYQNGLYQSIVYMYPDGIYGSATSTRLQTGNVAGIKMAKDTSMGVYWMDGTNTIRTVGNNIAIVSHTAPGQHVWKKVEISADGTVIAAIYEGSGYIWLYRNGVWEEQTDAGEREWKDIALGSEGTIIYAIEAGNNYVFRRELN